MRTNLSSRSYSRGATGPASTTAADVSPVASESCSQHWLPQAPRTNAAKNASKPRRGLLTSARKSLTTLRKRLPSMCLGAPATEATHPPGKPLASGDASKLSLQSPIPHIGRDAQSPASADTPSRIIPPRPPIRQQRPLVAALATERVQVWPSRMEETWQQQNAAHQRHRPPAPHVQGSPAHVTDRGSDSEYKKNGDRNWQQPGPGQISPDRGRQRQRSFQDESRSPAASSPSPTPSSSLPTQREYPTLLEELNAQLEPYHQRKYLIDTRGDRSLTTEEKELLGTRKVLIDQRNKIRDIQLDGMLEGLAPMEKISPPQTTTSHVSLVQYRVIDANRRAFSAIRDKKLDMGLIAREYARAQRHIGPLKNSGAAYSKIKRLERMMEGYQNWLALQQMVTHINGQLEDMDGPQLTDSDPSTPREREDAAREELELQQEAMENGYW